MGLLSHKLEWALANPLWAQNLNPLLAQPQSSGKILSNIVLVNGATIINHGLGRTLQGWNLVDINGAATIYRSAPFNSSTLTLTSNALVTVSIEVF